MDDELPSKEIGKLHNRGKITLMLAIGLFFSVYFWENGETGVWADKSVPNDADEPKKPLILPKTANFKFDPMERVVQSVEQKELAELKVYEKSLVQKEPLYKPKNPQEQRYRALIADSPLEEMLPFIIQCDNETASFLIAIAKKESDFGKHSPKKDGRNCFNYWGYRGIRDRMGTGGHTCFDSPKDAVDTVAKRIDKLIKKENLNTPEKIVVWKCGYDCSWDNKSAVNKWIQDVSLYFKKVQK